MDIIASHRVNAHEDDFDIDVDELDENSPKAEHPDDVGIKLKDHQLTIIKRCMDYESGHISLKAFDSIEHRVNEADSFTTNIGVIADRVGSGKSYVVLGIIKNSTITNQNKTLIRSTAINNVVFYLRNNRSVIKCNIIVIPFSLCSQWEAYIKAFDGNLSYKVINKSKIISDMVGRVEEAIKDYDILLVTSTFYNKFSDIVKRDNIKFQRIFYDEADTININNCAQLDANFYWFVTASYGNLVYPKGFAKQERGANRYIWCAEGLKSSGFIKNIFIDMHYSIPRMLIKTLIVKNSESYVQRSIELPPMITHTIICRTPNTITVLNGIVDKNIIACLNAGDTQRALQYVNPSHKLSADNIVNVIVDKYNRMLENIRVRKSIFNQLTFDDEAEKQREQQTLDNKEHELEKNIKLIKDRIETSNICSICYDDHENKTVVNCCQNSFCFKCINMWISQKNNCPFCKASLKSSDLYVQTDSNKKQPEPEEDDLEIGGIKGFRVLNDKVRNLQVLLEGKKGKILIFSSSDTTFMNVIPLLELSGIKYDFLKGNGNHVHNVIENYRKGDVDVLLVNTRYYGSGFNMENTTDIVLFHKFDTEIEKQVIGRAQRFGRKAPLNVWYLLHDHE